MSDHHPVIEAMKKEYMSMSILYVIQAQVFAKNAAEAKRIAAIMEEAAREMGYPLEHTFCTVVVGGESVAPRQGDDNE